MPGTFSIAVGGLAADKAQEQAILEDFKKLVQKYGAAIHQAQWDGAITGRHHLKDE